ncbi:hypothetical protein MKW98_012085 [Papaver atlanticum]|uniref:Eukaryotic translation initiation factor 2 subunit beta n=1 Tax=Papaver atlanticum TaxID=357466 RepID=A0AAD4THN2_9MAGN|nr:hypothetical protein MKW98_012085 [Papaver atlanticum]
MKISHGQAIGVEETEDYSAADNIEIPLPSFAGLKKKNTPADFLNEQENATENSKEKENETTIGCVLKNPEQETTISRVLKNPELAGRDRRSRTYMMNPQFIRGITQTILVNFMDVCESVHRQPEHVMDFIFREIGATGFLDGQQRLVIRRREIRFNNDDIKATLRNYENRYVRCLCKNLDTILSKQDSLFFLTCDQCGSVRSVPPYKPRFVADRGPFGIMRMIRR